MKHIIPLLSLQTGVKLFLHYGDLSDSTNLFHIISEVKPHEIYNLGAMSHVAVSAQYYCMATIILHKLCRTYLVARIILLKRIILH